MIQFPINFDYINQYNISLPQSGFIELSINLSTVGVLYQIIDKLLNVGIKPEVKDQTILFRLSRLQSINDSTSNISILF